MLPQFANRLLYLPVLWLRTACCFSFICLFIAIFAVATCIFRIAVCLLHAFALKELETRLTVALNDRRPRHA